MIIYLKPRSLFPSLHSDTIFGALLYTIKELYPEKFQDVLERFKNGDAPFLVSSAYPFLDADGEKLRFFPKPLMEPERHDMGTAKKMRKIRYVEESIFQSWIRSGEGYVSKNMDNYRLQDGLLFSKDINLDFKFDADTVPRNTINRVTNASENIFYSSGVRMKGVGLFFLVRFLDDDYEHLITGSMRFLSDRGFGGDISVGKGHFDHEISNENLLSAEGKNFITLSRYIPTKEEIHSMGDDLWYELGSKRGRGSDGTLRKDVKFFREGSTFKSMDRDIYGRVVESAREAVEYGLAYPVGVK
ncbi:MAG: type III-A CRISPR-associated RAMP protein Csm4 [Methanobacteriales archaeon Met13]